MVSVLCIIYNVNNKIGYEQNEWLKNGWLMGLISVVIGVI